MLRAALLALIALVALAVDPVDELTMAIRNGSPREALRQQDDDRGGARKGQAAQGRAEMEAGARQGANAQRVSRGRFARWLLWRPR